MDLKKTVDVANKSTGFVMINTSFGSHTFAPGQTRHNITLEELQELAQTPGGETMLKNFLYIEDPSIMKDILEIDVQPEYYIKEADIPNWMVNCSLDEFRDALDFAPIGTKDLIQKYAVSLPLNDYSKRQAMLEQLHFDVSAAIEAAKPDAAEEAKEVKPAGRRTTPTTAENAGRRTQVKIEIPKK